MFDRRYKMKDDNTWLKDKKIRSLNCSVVYPIKNPTKKEIIIYTPASNNFIETMLDRYLLSIC